MIHFACGQCGREMNVPDNAAGKSGTCKTCNAIINVPRVRSSLIVPESTVQKIKQQHRSSPEQEEYAPVNQPLQIILQPVINNTVHATAHAQAVVVQQGASPGPGCLAVASLACGIFSMLGCWVPFLGLLVIPVASVGALLGVIAALASFFTGHGFITGLVGLMLCVFAVGVAGISTAAGTAAITNAALEAEQRSRQHREQTEQAVPVTPVVPTQLEPQPEVQERESEPVPTSETIPKTSKVRLPDERATIHSEDAARKLKLAKQMLEKHQSKSMPMKYLKEIVDKYPNTESARDAAELIKANQ